MTKPWISDSRQRTSKKYRQLHEALRRDVYGARSPSLASKSPKQIRKFAKSELHRLYGDVP